MRTLAAIALVALAGCAHVLEPGRCIIVLPEGTLERAELDMDRIWI